MTSILSPLAPSFEYNTSDQKKHFNDYESFSFSVIYNEGAPCLVMCGSQSAISGISDETIEEYFPPTAEEIAELETLDNYTDLLATLDVLEKREESARKFCHFKKRWEVRRAEGSFTVRQIKKNLYPGYGSHESLHHSAGLKDDEIIRHGFHPKLHNSNASWPQLPRNSFKKNKILISKRFNQNTKLIQQPRKQN